MEDAAAAAPTVAPAFGQGATQDLDAWRRPVLSTEDVELNEDTMHRRIAATTFILALALLQPASAAEISPNRMGAGGSSCEALLKLEAFRVSSTSVQWAVGFIVGRAWADEQRLMVGSGTSALAANIGQKTDADIADDLKKICEAKPSRTLFEATDLLVAALSVSR